jgi:hypothetical protein
MQRIGVLKNGGLKAADTIRLQDFWFSEKIVVGLWSCDVDFAGA